MGDSIMKALLLALFLYSPTALADSYSVGELFETNEGLFFSRLHPSNLGKVIMKKEIHLKKIPAEEGAEVGWVRATLRFKKFRSAHRQDLPESLRNLSFKPPSLRALEDCQLNSQYKDQLLGVSQPSPIRGHQFTASGSYICNFTFGVKIREGGRELFEKLLEEAEAGRLIQTRFEPVVLSVFEKTLRPFNLIQMAEDLLSTLPDLETQDYPALQVTFIWASQMTTQIENWNQWQALSSSQRAPALELIYSRLFEDQGDGKIQLKKLTEIQGDPILEIEDIRLDREVTYEP